MPTEVVQQVYTGKLKPDVLTLAMTLDQYEAYKSDTPKAAREIGQRVERLRTDMKSVFGKQKLKYTPLTDITRQDANDLRDHLLSRVSVLDWCVGEGELGLPTPWAALKVKDRPEVHPHGVLTDDQVSVLLAAKDRVLHSALLFGLLTGMRSGEICGLMAEDITAKGNLGRFVSIRPNCGSLAEVQGS